MISRLIDTFRNAAAFELGALIGFTCGVAAGGILVGLTMIVGRALITMTGWMP